MVYLVMVFLHKGEVRIAACWVKAMKTRPNALVIANGLCVTSFHRPLSTGQQSVGEVILGGET